MAEDLDAFRRELDLYIDEALGEAGRRSVFVATAAPVLAAFEASWRARAPGVRFERFVDGAKGRPLEAVRIPGGVVLERVNAVAPILQRALELFDILTKVVTGGYKAQTFAFADGARIASVGQLDAGDDFVVVANVSKFARKAEREGFNIRDGAVGSDGLFETIAAQLQREFADAAASIYFTFRTIEGDRVPVLAIGGSALFAGRRSGGRGSRGRRGFDSDRYRRNKGR